ncbi:MAG: hypothetical protein FWH27_09085 [Planctomycetaceae bacterium]|nr:hypothetical protein [Planctomycetaceae bacterium]
MERFTNLMQRYHRLMERYHRFAQRYHRLMERYHRFAQRYHRLVERYHRFAQRYHRLVNRSIREHLVITQNRMIPAKNTCNRHKTTLTGHSVRSLRDLSAFPATVSLCTLHSAFCTLH